MCTPSPQFAGPPIFLLTTSNVVVHWPSAMRSLLLQPASQPLRDLRSAIALASFVVALAPTTSFALDSARLATALIGQLPDGQEVPANDLDDEAGFVSAPTIRLPYFLCSNLVSLGGVIKGADLEIEAEIDGQSYTIQKTASAWGDMEVSLPKQFATTADFVRVRQTIAGDTSIWNLGSTLSSNHASDWKVHYNNQLPEPTLYYEDFYDCGRAVGITHYIPGSAVWATSTSTQGISRILGSVLGRADPRLEFTYNDFFEAEALNGHYRFCGEEVASQPYIVKPRPTYPGGFPAPRVQGPYEDSQFVLVEGIVRGAIVELYDQADQLLGEAATVSNSVWIQLNRALMAKEPLYARQRMGSCTQSLPGPTIEVRPCSELGAPVIRRPAPGDLEVIVETSEPDALILVYDVNGTLIGRGVAPKVSLARKLTTTEEIRVTQKLGSCHSSTAYRIHVDCGSKGRAEMELLNRLTHRRRRRGTHELKADQCK